MRRLLTTLIILLVVLVAGMSALVLLVNPNDFRAYMVKQVERKSGYHLQLEGDLRWHVWPQLSIIAGRMALTAPGAATPVVSAENMRLDVKLWPLLSHQLDVKQVMLKGAVIRLTPDSEAQQQPGAPVAPTGNAPVDEQRAWKLDINKVQVADSLLIWQRTDNDQVNVRDINLELQQDAQRQIHVTLASRINRNQRDITFSMVADVDMSHYPQQFGANVSQFSYKLEGADIPVGGVSGEGLLQASYQHDIQQLLLNELSFTANNNQLTGSAKATFGPIPEYVINLAADNLNLDAIFGWKPQNTVSTEDTAKAATVTAPVIAIQADDVGQDLQALRDFTAQVTLTANNLVYRAIKVSHLNLQASNQQGDVQISRLTGNALGGDFSLPGSLDVTGKKVLAAINPVINHMELGPVLVAVGLPQTMTGKFSMKAQLSGDGLDVDAFNHRWKGNAQFSMNNARLEGLNIQQLIQQAVTRSSNDVKGQDRYERYTAVKQLQANLALNRGKMNISNLSADSELIAINGKGELNLPAQQCDMNLSVRVMQGWSGEDRLVKFLQNTNIPLRIYGSWTQLSYQLNVEQLLRNELQQRAKEALRDWSLRNEDNRARQDLKKLIDKL
ncbi:outer membrane assembly protein AsmA [Yersinia enterocolitica]|uniref:outer membrane assembly protein AsmA n=1 Tax=Yersinia enterocolitica TaxID=630 RepID=UPI0021E72911|nr:outer membrane assembly protein AsmA [Yersinia enterocolitica]EKN3338755.1 outer membrane assembly protein AsmA [Yersinia enterocolitica]EKN3499122.1 outer membrane assembly protein AsmA [Yersinia enterocolitica]EKN3972355.1 outer membrane assembly protein AsmA [Yersinia enterocolitica]EKN4027038.1 outer membrane assembly protein AsmA [Yersinia enterocolitica]EKN4061256.1 outer membrane assembly protein AsmA [Yersinia enterocolitica]